MNSGCTDAIQAPSKSPPVGETLKLKPSLPGRVWVGLTRSSNFSQDL